MDGVVVIGRISRRIQRIGEIKKERGCVVAACPERMVDAGHETLTVSSHRELGYKDGRNQVPVFRFTRSRNLREERGLDEVIVARMTDDEHEAARLLPDQQRELSFYPNDFADRQCLGTRSVS